MWVYKKLLHGICLPSSVSCLVSSKITASKTTIQLQSPIIVRVLHRLTKSSKLKEKRRNSSERIKKASYKLIMFLYFILVSIKSVKDVFFYLFHPWLQSENSGSSKWFLIRNTFSNLLECRQIKTFVLFCISISVYVFHGFVQFRQSEQIHPWKSFLVAQIHCFLPIFFFVETWTT